MLYAETASLLGPYISKFPNSPISKSAETEPHQALHYPRRASAGDLPKCRLPLLPGRFKAGRRVHAVELGVVEPVVHLPPQLQRPPGAPQGDPLEERHVRVVRAGQADDVLVPVAAIAGGWRRDDCVVVPERGARVADSASILDQRTRAVSP